MQLHIGDIQADKDWQKQTRNLWHWIASACWHGFVLILHPVHASLYRAALCGGYPIIGHVITYLLSNLLSGFYCSPCDIGFASLGAIKTALCVAGYHTQAIVFALCELFSTVSCAIIRWRSYLHTVSSSICIRPSLSIVLLCLFVCYNVYGQAMYQPWSKDGREWTRDERQKFKTKLGTHL